jgi:formamidopyrimidine-DNA glycosylase
VLPAGDEPAAAQQAHQPVEVAVVDDAAVVGTGVIVIRNFLYANYSHPESLAGQLRDQC